MLKLPFTKMQGTGNDYIYVNCMHFTLSHPERLSQMMSARRFAVGSDGLVLICPSAVADAKMRMFNTDGSEGKMCGNAIRCIGKYLYDNRLVTKEIITIETLSGIRTLKLETGKYGLVEAVTVDMGRAEFTPGYIPVILQDEMINEPMEVAGKTWSATAVSMGNPHCVVFSCDGKSLDPDTLPLEEIGPVFESHPLFPERVNTEFVSVITPTHLKMRVWERGSGETLACGTGACAVAAAAVKNGISPCNTPITVSLRGGDLTLWCSEDYKMTMKGGAVKVYDGVFEYEEIT